ncbi:MAG: hypothetical protein ABSF80_11465 [Chitinispirillaceae bacterium]|jgi:hypothetical protein
MKKLVVCMAAIAILAGSTGVAAQTKTNMITVNPLGLIIGYISLDYEKAIGPKTTLGILPYFWSPKGIDITLLGGSIAANFYSNSAFHGWFIRPSVSIGYASWNYTTFDINLNEITNKSNLVTFGVGAIAGYRWLFQSGFSIGLGGGVNWTGGTFAGIDFGGVGPSLLFDLGWAF